MKLQSQLLLVSLLMLSLPWAGCQYVREVESALRRGQEQSLTATVEAVAAALAADTTLLYPFPERLAAPGGNGQRVLYFHQLPREVRVDGYGEDWEGVPAAAVGSEQGAFRVAYRTGIYDQRLYLYFDVLDDQVTFYKPSLPTRQNGDRLILLSANARYLLNAAAPGELAALRRRPDGELVAARDIRAQWQMQPRGYSIELSLPLSLSGGRLAFIAVDQAGERVRGSAGTVSVPNADQPPWVVYRPAPLQARLRAFVRPGLRLQVTGRGLWQLADAGSVAVAADSEVHWMLRELYRSLLAPAAISPVSAEDTRGRIRRPEVEAAAAGETSARWYRQQPRSRRTLLSIAAPIAVDDRVVGTVVAEQSNDQFLVLTGGAFSRLLLYGLLALALTGFGLLGYAGWLSWRVRRLSRAASEVLSDDGRILDRFPLSKAPDEIGDLTRSYGELLQRIREYTDYLRTLSRKLSHELRTPLAVVHSSLDNLSQQTLSPEARVYHRRAHEGAARLSRILTAMGEASRVEESIRSAERQRVPLLPFLQDVVAAYRDVYTGKQLQLATDLPADLQVTMAPELMVQLLDKLVDNAADFTPDGGEITFGCRVAGGELILQVINDGPLLPAQLQHQLFDNMVSLREPGQQGGLHLGLGLHIVRLIAEFHGGRVRAFNRADGAGVCFECAIALRDHGAPAAADSEPPPEGDSSPKRR